MSAISKVLLESIRETREIVPLYTAGLISKDEAQNLTRKLFEVTKDYDTLEGLINREVFSAKDTWVKNAFLGWMGRDPVAVLKAIEWGVYTADEVKPLALMHLIRFFMEERGGAKNYRKAAELLFSFRAKDFLSRADEDNLLTSVFLLRAELPVVFTPSTVSA